MRLIDADALKEEFRKIYHCAEKMEELANAMEDAIDNAPPLPNPFQEEQQTQSLISKYQHDFVSSPTEVIKVGEPLSNSDEIRQAFENGEIYKRGRFFEDARKRYERPTGHWIIEECSLGKTYYCSECYAHQEVCFDFCPYCGADMRGDKE